MFEIIVSLRMTFIKYMNIEKKLSSSTHLLTRVVKRPSNLEESGSFRPWVVSAWVVSANFWGGSFRPKVSRFGPGSFRP